MAKDAPNKVLKAKKTKITLCAKGEKQQIQLRKYTKTTTESVRYKVTEGKNYIKVDKYGIITVKRNPGKKAQKAKIRINCGNQTAVIQAVISKK